MLFVKSGPYSSKFITQNKTNMAKPNLLNSVQMVKPGKNRFDLSHDVKLSCNMGQLVPVMMMECVPGDSVTLSAESLIRFAPLVAPMMHRVDVTFHSFFVPNRILWPNWEKFITNTPLESTGELPAHPYIDLDVLGLTKLTDYAGLPNAAQLDAGIIRINPMIFAAYQKVYNEYYRDQNLIEANIDTLVDGSQGLSAGDLLALRYRAWEHDYFTAALPFAQKGAAVDLPLGTVELKEDWLDTDNPPHFVNNAGDSDGGAIVQGDLPGFPPVINVDGTALGAVAYDPAGSLVVGATTINDLRRAMRLQEWLEKNARGGTRYIENILVHFGVRSSDKRLQRPEYITGTKTPVTISEVLNTTGTEDAPQGNMAGHGVSVTGGKYGKYFCEEHGYILTIMSVLPLPAYQQGVPKHFLKFDPFDYYWPSFAHIGEQEVKNIELYAAGNPEDLEVFGYVPRYSEYKFMFNRVAGEFRTTLNFWHMGRIFASRPALNAAFVTANPTTRVFAVDDPDVDHLWCHIYNKISAVRPMPKFGTPTL